jgi:two-component sensor histidine kinase
MVAELQRESLVVRPRDFVDILRTPWAFSTSTILVFCALVLLPTVATEYSRLTNPIIPVAIGIGLISVTANGAILFIIRGAITDGFRRSAWAVVALLVSAGALRGVVTSLIVAPTQLETRSYLVTRVGLGAVSSPIMIAVVALVLSRFITSRQQRRRSRREISAATRSRDLVLGEVAAANAQFFADIDGTLRPAVDAIIAEVANGCPERAALSTALDNLAETVVRPLSHTIARSDSVEHGSRGSIERQVFGPNQPTLRDLINPYFSALGVGLGGFSVMLDGLPGASAIVASVVAGLTSLGFLLIARAIFGTRPMSIRSSVLIVAGLHEVIWIPAQVLNDLLIFPSNLVVNYAILGVIATPLLGLVYQLIVLSAYSSRQQLAALDGTRIDAVLQQSEARRTAWLRQRHIAHTLHSSIQSRIHAQARLLRAGTGKLTDAERADTTMTLQSVLRVLTEEPPARVDAIRSITELAEFWSGMCDISLEVDEASRVALAIDSDAAEAISVVSLEIVSNAIRHGNATAVDIAITRDSPETVTLSAINDGALIDPKHTPGLGMSIYEELTASWSVRSTDHVTVEAVIAARGNKQTL